MKIDVAELIEQFTKLRTWLRDNKEQIGKMNTGITTFVAETQSTFQGEAGDGVRACMMDIFTPLHQQFEVTEQTLTQAIDTIKNKAESYFGTNGIVDDGYLDEWLNQVERTVRDFDYMSDDINAQVRNVSDLISVSNINRDSFHEPLYVMKKHVTEVKSQMKDFEAEATTLTNQVSTEVSKLTSMLKEVSGFNGDMSTYKSGGFKFQALSTVKEFRYSKEETIKYLVDTYGFDNLTAEKLYRLQNKIAEKHPDWDNKEVTFEFYRICAGCCFNDKTEQGYVGKRWSMTAGIPETLDDTKVILEEYGFNEEEYEELLHNITNQHENANTQKDFAHEAVQIAAFNTPMILGRVFVDRANEGYTILNVPTGMYNMEVIIPEFRSYTNEEISWKGDYDSRRFDQTDIRSDIDAVNVNNRIKNSDKLPLEAQQDYQSDIILGQTDRQDEFYKNYGNGDIEQGKKEVKRILDVKSVARTHIESGRDSIEEGKNSDNDFWRYIENA